MTTITGHFPSGKTVRVSLFVALLAWAMFAGKDVSWDVLNHHFYLPFSWLSGRFRTDLFAAGGQSYQNPLGYFPVYALVRAGLPAWIVGVVLSASHALVVWPLDRLARLFWPADTDEDFWYRLLALLLCCIAPIFLIQCGSSSSDPLTALMVLWAIGLTLAAGLVSGSTSAETRGAAIAGALLGLACAVKLSNAAFALALCALWLVKWLLGQAGWRRLFAFGAGLAVVFAIAAGPWMWWLWQDFRNPIFPLFNNVFRSAFLPPEAIVTMRFLPRTPWDLVARLWEMAEYSSFVAFEAFLPDLRPLLAALAGLAAAALLALRGGLPRIASRAVWRGPGVQLALLLVLTYVLWMRSSGNARYALPLFLVIGVALVRATQRVMPYRAAKVFLLTALLLQGADYLALGEYRFQGARWDGGPYIDYRVSQRLREQPFLHLSIGSETNAAVALFLAPTGAMANPIGSIPLPLDGPLGARLRSLMDQWHGRTRVLFNAAQGLAPDEEAALHLRVRALVYRLGIDVDWSDCEKVEVLLGGGASAAPVAAARGKASMEPVLLSCAISYRTDKDSVADAELLAANRVFALMEAACPKLFAPTPLASEHAPGVWQRKYLNTSAVLSVSAADGVNFSQFRMFSGAHFGSIDDVLNHRNPIQCPRIDYQTPM